MPEGWGKDELSAFLDGMRGNQLATYDGKEVVRDLIKLDACFRKLLVGAINPRPWFPMTFMLRAHSAFLAACSLAMACDNYNQSAMLRNCLECAVYGVFIGGDDSRATVWLNRHNDEHSLRAMKSMFMIVSVKAHLGTLSKTLHDQFSILYEQSIDYGGHPNERGFSLNARLEKLDDENKFITIYLNEDGPALEAGLKNVVQVGLWVLLTFRLVYANRYELLGINQTLEEFRNRY